ncbi:NAD(P)H-binding protein [Ottowia thiooxydans]|uniref:NAD(P)H-binding protein n=1 Tax=Ottowia thiooxydans TaxID=219182 RepID=UPI000426D54C|nr:NAD(P)H-binding protein [Ottowia thiooxydans]
MTGHTITITGASGKLGRAISEELASRVPVSLVTLGTRSPESLQAFGASGYRVMPVNFDEPSSVEEAFRGAAAMLLICGHGSNETRIRQHMDAIDAAKRCSTGRIYYTSFTNPTKASLFPFAKVHEASEAHARASGLRYTFLRNNHYAENLETALQRAHTSGELSLPGARGKVAYIARQDVAAATAGALALSQVEASYELSGPEALDLFEVADLASEAWGRKITARDMPADEYRSLLIARGLSPFAAEGQVGIRLASGAGEYGEITRNAEQLAGRALRTMRQYLHTFSRETLTEPSPLGRV